MCVDLLWQHIGSCNIDKKENIDETNLKCDNVVQLNGCDIQRRRIRQNINFTEKMKMVNPGGQN